ncbi:sensor domain-containing diguanylate cyclase [Acidihalobacter aeolianus]|nr:GGDEF domain-containing protein [Acidihalobacter aeolianus]
MTRLEGQFLFSESKGEGMPGKNDGDVDAFSQLPVGLAIAVDGLLAHVNPIAQQILEAEKPDDLLGRSLFDFVEPADLAQTQSRLRRLAVDGTPNPPTEIRLLSLRGNLRVVVASSRMYIFQGTPALMIAAHDMTRMHQIHEQLRDNEQSLRQVFESMQDVYYRTDAQGVVQMVGPGVRRVLGYEPHEIIGRKAEDYYPHPVDRDAFKQAIRDHGEVSDFPGQMVRSDGQVIDISISSHALFDENGNFAGVEGIYRDVTERKMLERELLRLATTDPLTGIANRRAFLERASEHLKHCRRYGSHLVLIILDLDHFKAINDRYGHVAGDRVLVRFVDEAKQELRETDLFGRLGGEEFCVILEQTTIEPALKTIERIQQRMRTTNFEDNGERYTVTVSAGGTENLPEDANIERLLERADKALYQAKNDGRDRTAWYQE